MAQNDSRPDPEKLLARVKAAESRTQRGKLKIFLGYAAGVGKTYTMLEFARLQKNDRDLVVGYVEIHNRQETETLLQGLEVIPRRQIEYRGVSLSEMDLDAVLARHPDLAIIDEYAHTNAPGSRHNKRYQDIEELLEAGISVYTTLNIQHVESLRNIVAQVTDVWMRETLPDSAVDMADEIELVDIPPDELIKRLQAGKVYISDVVSTATEKFFRKGNLTALRELAMRTVAQHVEEQMRAYMEEKSIPGPWPAGERLLVWVSPDTAGPTLVRSARRLAAQLGAAWFAVQVDTPRSVNMSIERREALTGALQLAERLGAKVVTLQGQNVSEALTDYAGSHNITKIVVGQPSIQRWQEWMRVIIINQIIRRNRDLDVYIIKTKSEPRQKEIRAANHLGRQVRKYFFALILVAAATGLSALLRNALDPTNLVMIYLLSTVLAALYLGLGPSILVALTGVLIFDFVFVPPKLSFAVGDIKFFFSMVALLTVGIIISYLTAQFRRQTEAAWLRERQTSELLSLGRDLAVSSDLDSYIKSILKRTRDTFEYEAIIFLPDPQNQETLKAYTEKPDSPVSEKDRAAAQWAFEHRKTIGRGTDTLPNAGARYFPLLTAREVMGVLALLEPPAAPDLTLNQQRLMEAYADLAAVAIEGIHLAQENRANDVLIAGEKLQTALLNSISHDLKTPLVSIIGALSSLQEEKIKLDDESIQKLIQVAREQAERLNRLITNLLDESRLEAGAIKLNRQPCEVKDLVGSALEQLGDNASSHHLRIELPDNLPFVSADFGLLVRVLVNILDNALKYSPEGSLIEISGQAEGQFVRLDIADSGKGIPPQDLEHVFDKFYRVQRPEKVTGTGLGLSIARGIVEAHGGRIAAQNRDGGGTIIRLSLPIAEMVAKDSR